MSIRREDLTPPVTAPFDPRRARALRSWLPSSSAVRRLCAVLALLMLTVGAGRPVRAQTPQAAPSAVASPSAAPAAHASAAPAAHASAAPLTVPSAAPAGSPAPQATPVPLSIVIDKAEAVRVLLDKIKSDLGDDPELDQIDAQVRTLKRNLQEFGVRADHALGRDPSFDTVQGLSTDLRSLTGPLDEWANVLNARTKNFEDQRATLDDLEVTWQASLRSVTSDGAPSDVIETVRAVCVRIDTTQEQVDKWLRTTLSIQNRVAEAAGLFVEINNQLAGASTRAAQLLLRADEAPLWSSDAYDLAGMGALSILSIEMRVRDLVQYVQSRPRALMGHLGLVLLLFLILRAADRQFALDDDITEETRTLAITRSPLASAYALSVLGFSLLYPLPPRIFSFLMLFSGLVAVVVALRSVMNPRFYVGAYALAALGILDGCRAFLLGALPVFRVALAFEQIAALTFFIWVFSSGRLRSLQETAPKAVFFARVVGVFQLLGFLLSFFANVCGFVSLSRYVLNLTTGPVYVALMIRGGVFVVDAILVYLLRVWPLSGLAAVTRNSARVRGGLRLAFTLGAIWLWVRFFVNQAPMRTVVIMRVQAFLGADLGLAGLTPGSLLSFLGIIIAAFITSRVVLALLAEDVYPRLSLPAGVPFAISTMLHYVMVVLGFMLALSSLGMDLTRFTLLVSAFGVGLGFGLQTIVNNLVSGLILLFERPVKIGDVIEMGNSRGVLTHIGLRASILHASDGSDVILPNGTLLSSNVVNYTLADEQRRLEVEVLIPMGYDAQQVMTMLADEASKVPHILKNPAPECLFVKFTDKQVVLQVRAWVESTEHWRSCRSALNTTVYSTLLRTGLIPAMPPLTEK